MTISINYITNKMVIIFLIFLLRTLPAQTSLEINMQSKFTVTLDIPCNSWRCIKVESGRLMDNTQNCIAVTGLNKTVIFKFTSDSLIKVFEHDFTFNKITMGPDIPDLITGDFNRNNIEELVICLPQKLLQIEWNGNHFVTSEYDFQYSIYDCVGGDVTNDGSDEIVLACLPEPIFDNPDKAVWEIFSIIVCNLHDNKLNTFYKKIEDVNIEISTVLQPDNLVCISDFDNTGSNKLLISEAQSDVSPTYFRSYSWQSNANSFLLHKRFVIMNKTIFPKRDRSLKMLNYVCNNFKDFVLEGKKYFLATEIGDRGLEFPRFGTTIFKLENDSLTASRVRHELNRIAFIESNELQQPGFMTFSVRKHFDINQLECEYYSFQKSSINTDYLQSERFKNLDIRSLNELRLLRNELFARHGHSFSDNNLKAHFQSQSWYKEIAGNKVSSDDLSVSEKNILEKIQQIEKAKKAEFEF